MSTVRQIEQAIRELTPEALAELRDWFAEYDADQWDRQIETDLAAGRLDALIAEAAADAQTGRCRDL